MLFKTEAKNENDFLRIIESILAFEPSKQFALFLCAGRILEDSDFIMNSEIDDILKVSFTIICFSVLWITSQ